MSFIERLKIATRLLSLVERGGTSSSGSNKDGTKLSERLINTTKCDVWLELVPQLLGRLERIENNSSNDKNKTKQNFNNKTDNNNNNNNKKKKNNAPFTLKPKINIRLMEINSIKRKEEKDVLLQLLARLCSIYPIEMSWHAIGSISKNIINNYIQKKDRDMLNIHRSFARDVKALAFTSSERWILMLRSPTMRSLTKMKGLLKKMYSTHSSDSSNKKEGVDDTNSSSSSSSSICLDRSTFEKQWRSRIRDACKQVSTLIDDHKYEKKRGRYDQEDSEDQDKISKIIWKPLEELRRDISESIKGSTTSLFISNMIENKQGWQSRLTQVVLPTMVSTSGVPDLQFEATWDQNNNTNNTNNISNNTSNNTQTLIKIENKVEILDGSKKKPKKMITLNSQGVRKTWLVKGGDAPEVDQRVVQMQVILNRCCQLSSKNSITRFGPGARAETYRVVPIGSTTSMIEWVEHRTSLFTLYQRWWRASTSSSISSSGSTSGSTSGSGGSGTSPASLVRKKGNGEDKNHGETKTAAVTTATATASGTSGTSGTTKLRRCNPSDDFYRILEIEIRATCDMDNNLNNVLSDVTGQKELRSYLFPLSSSSSFSSKKSKKSINTTMNVTNTTTFGTTTAAADLKQLFSMYRSSFARALLTRVFKELSRTTSQGGILERELTMSSCCMEERWSKLDVYKRSLAYNSMVGHVLGLGDRHLDNILIDM